MTTPVLFPDVELWCAGWLRSALAGRTEPYAQNVYVGNTVPSPRRDRMVTFRRDGGPRLDQVRELARVGVNVWATSERDATDLARLVAALLWAAPDGAPVLRAQQVSGPSPVPDEQPRRFMSFELTVRGTNL